MADTPAISIVTASYNSAATLARAIDKLLAQGYPRLEYIVIDGGSTDGTVDIIRGYEKHIAFWRSQKDSGISEALNFGVTKCTGDIVGILNSDDWYEPGILAEVGRAFAQDPSLDVVSCEAEVVKYGDAGKLELIEQFAGPRIGLSPDAIPSPNIRFFRRAWLEKHGAFQEEVNGVRIRIANDVELLLRLCITGAKSKSLHRHGYTFLSHAGSLTLSGNAGDSKGRKSAREERRVIAERFLHWEAPLPRGLRFWLQRLHSRASAYLFFYAKKAGDGAEAKRVLARGMRHAPLLLPYEIMRLYLSGRYRKP